MIVEQFRPPRRTGAKRRRGARRVVKRTRRFVVGRDQTSGYYGRFSRAGGEMKFHDVSVDDAVIAATMTINNLTIIAQGNNESQRIGRKITIKKISWKYRIALNSKTDADQTADNVRFMLVQDIQTNGAQFTALNLLETDTWQSFRNLANSSRFRVLMTKDVSVNVTGAAPSGAAFAFGTANAITIGNKACSIPIEYDNSATTGAIATVRSNNLYWVTQSSNGVTVGVGNVRLRYNDA